jgi:molecular chaperone DnaK (HSP70)
MAVLEGGEPTIPNAEATTTSVVAFTKRAAVGAPARRQQVTNQKHDFRSSASWGAGRGLER